MFDEIELGSKIITNDNNVGDDAKYLPEYEQVIAEISKLSSMQGGEINWNNVINLSVEILDKHSKDLTIAVYLNVALIMQNGAEGFLKGLVVLNNLLQSFGDNLYPKRQRARTNAISFWQDKVLAFLEKDISAISENDYKKLNDTIKEFDRQIGDFLPDCPPLFNIVDRVSRLNVERTENVQVEAEKNLELEKVEEQKTEIIKQDDLIQEKVSEQAVQTSEPSLIETQAKQVEQELQKNQQVKLANDPVEALNNFITASTSLNNLAFTNELQQMPLYWSNFFISLWAKIKQLPPAENKVTMIAPFDFDSLNPLKALLNAKRYEEAALQAVQTAPQYPFCLDIIYILAKSLEKCGDTYNLALKIVQTRTMEFISQYPEIINYKYNDGSDFVSSEAKAWLENLSKPIQVSIKNDDTADDKISKIIQDANNALNQRDLAAALEVFRQAKLSSISGEELTILKCEEMDLILQEGKIKLAETMVDSLNDDMINFNLKLFKPELALTILKLTYICYKDSDAAKAQKIISEIAGLSPSAALTLLS